MYGAGSHVEYIWPQEPAVIGYMDREISTTSYLCDVPSRPASSLSTHIEQENTYTVGYNVRQDGYSLCLTQRVLHTYFMYVVTLSWLFFIYVQCMTSVQ